MKKIITRPVTLLSIVFLSICSLSLFSCDEDDWDEDYLIGSWVSTDSWGNEIYLDFYDGTGRYNEYQDLFPLDGETFRWEVSHRKIIVRYWNGDSSVWPFRTSGHDHMRVKIGHEWIPFVRTSGGYFRDIQKKPCATFPSDSLTKKE